MSQLKNTNPILTIYLFLLITHFSICNASSSSSVLDFITEPEMESETSRRLLAMQKKYISYETLNRDLVPCARPGASYYNCHAVAANPYSRGCEVITRCRANATVGDHLSVVASDGNVGKEPVYVLVKSNLLGPFSHCWEGV